MAVALLFFVLINFGINSIYIKKRFILKCIIVIEFTFFYISSSLLLCKQFGTELSQTIIFHPSLINFWLIIITGGVLSICLYLFHCYLCSKFDFKQFLVISKIISMSITFLLIFIGFLAFFSTLWLKKHFGGVGIDEIIYTISQPLSGSESSQVVSYIFGPLIQTIFFTITIHTLLVCLLLLNSLNLQRIKILNAKKSILYLSGVLVLFLGVGLSIHSLGFLQLKAYFFEKATIFETYYVDPTKTKLTFPTKKRNLIYIYMESMESSYTSKINGGIQTDNLIPNLTRLGEENINFSNTSKLGGAVPVPSTGFTMGGMVAQTAGIPLKVAVGEEGNDGDKANVYGGTDSYLPGAYSLGDILNTEGYQQALLIGSDAEFSGKGKYFEQHGNYDIWDYKYAKKAGWIPSDYNVWWGYEDAKLFQFAKNQLIEMSKKNQPFNLTMLTADTHFEDGYMSSETPKVFDDQYSNVIHYSDYMVAELVKWIQEQSFYDNTTVIISGDHLTMDSDFYADLSSSYQRSVYNVIINSIDEPKKKNNRLFTTMDMYPTTLAALGVEINGNRLGLGTNLYSRRATLAEQLGYKNYYNELSKRSKYFEKNIAKGTDKKMDAELTSTTNSSTNSRVSSKQ
jgi:phosphoglycerol transferase